MKKLIILINEFPYGNWESYFETEIKYLDMYKEKYIFSLQLRKSKLKNKRIILSPGVYNFKILYAKKIIYLLYALKVLFDKNLYLELYKVLKGDKKIKKIVKLFIFLSRSHYEADKIIRIIRKKIKKDDKNVLIYSYRFEYQPYVALLIKKKFNYFKIIAKAHGSDLYEYVKKENYIPMREYILHNINNVILISEHGIKYLSNNYPKYNNKMIVYKLGTLDYGYVEYASRDNIFKIVTCSNLNPLKRIELLVYALSNISKVFIEWTHYGDGVEKENIIKLCKEKLPSNISFYFKGHVENHKVIKEYIINEYNLFINISKSEGIPVSIMEALSVGIPCIATDVGGNIEIIKDRYNGRVLNKNFKIEELKELIIEFASIDEKKYLKYRRRARESWKNFYNADINYKKFEKFINNI